MKILTGISDLTSVRLRSVIFDELRRDPPSLFELRRDGQVR